MSSDVYFWQGDVANLANDTTKVGCFGCISRITVIYSIAINYHENANVPFPIVLLVFVARTVNGRRHDINGLRR